MNGNKLFLGVIGAWAIIGSFSFSLVNLQLDRREGKSVCTQLKITALQKQIKTLMTMQAETITFRKDIKGFIAARPDFSPELVIVGDYQKWVDENTCDVCGRIEGHRCIPVRLAHARWGGCGIMSYSLNEFFPSDNTWAFVISKNGSVRYRSDIDRRFRSRISAENEARRIIDQYFAEAEIEKTAYKLLGMKEGKRYRSLGEGFLIYKGLGIRTYFTKDPSKDRYWTFAIYKDGTSVYKADTGHGFNTQIGAEMEGIKVIDQDFSEGKTK